MIYCVLIFGSILLSTRIRPLKQLFPCSSNRFTLFWQERLLMSLADLISMTALLGITAPVREAAAAFGRGDARGKGSIIAYSRWMEPKPGQGPGTNGLNETVLKRSHYTWTSTQVEICSPHIVLVPVLIPLLVPVPLSVNTLFQALSDLRTTDAAINAALGVN